MTQIEKATINIVILCGEHMICVQTESFKHAHDQKPFSDHVYDEYSAAGSAFGEFGIAQAGIP